MSHKAPAGWRPVVGAGRLLYYTRIRSDEPREAKPQPVSITRPDVPDDTAYPPMLLRCERNALATGWHVRRHVSLAMLSDLSTVASYALALLDPETDEVYAYGWWTEKTWSYGRERSGQLSNREFQALCKGGLGEDRAGA